MSELKKYYKLTVETENHHGFVYGDGLNVDTVAFDKTGSCCAGGLYFSDSENITQFLENHRWIREITIPEGEKDFVKDPSNNPPKWRSHSVVCGSRKDLKEVSTWEWMVSEGIVIDYDYALRYSASNDRQEIVKYLLSLENVKFSQDAYDDALRYSAKYDRLVIVKYLLSLENVKFSQSAYDDALRYSASNDRLEIVKYLHSLENVKFSQDAYDDALRNSAQYDRLEIVKYLLSLENVKFSQSAYDDALRYSAKYDRVEIVTILKSFDKSKLI